MRDELLLAAEYSQLNTSTYLPEKKCPSDGTLVTVLSAVIGF